MARQRMVLTSIWKRSRKFRACDRDARYLYLYFITNDDVELCGAYEQTVDDICHFTGLAENQFQAAMAELEREGLAYYRDGWIILPTYAERQSKDNPKVQKGIENSLSALPEWVCDALKGWGMDRASMPDDRASMGHAFTIPDLDSDSDSDSDYDTDSEEEVERLATDFEDDPEDEEPKPPQKIPPDGGGAVAPLSPLSDSLANHYQERMTEVQPASSWGNVSKERGQLTTLAKKTRRLLPDTPFEDDVGLANALLSQYMAMRRSERSEYWRNAPFSPSGLAARWDQVVTALAREHEHAEAWRTA